MKKTVILFLVLAVAASCAREPKFRIAGTIDGADSALIILQKRIPGGYEAIDSVALANGAFEMTGVIDYPQMVNLAIKGKRGGLNFYLENSEITIHGHADSLYPVQRHRLSLIHTRPHSTSPTTRCQRSMTVTGKHAWQGTKRWHLK
jgi:hypothetical protein